MEASKRNIINWSRLARQYNVLIRGKTPGNTGQVLKAYAEAHGKIVKDPCQTYLHQIRRSK